MALSVLLTMNKIFALPRMIQLMSHNWQDSQLIGFECSNAFLLIGFCGTAFQTKCSSCSGLLLLLIPWASVSWSLFLPLDFLCDNISFLLCFFKWTLNAQHFFATVNPLVSFQHIFPLRNLDFSLSLHSESLTLALHCCFLAEALCKTDWRSWDSNIDQCASAHSQFSRSRNNKQCGWHLTGTSQN